MKNETFLLLGFFLSITIGFPCPAARAQQTQAAKPPSEFYQNALDPSQPADQPLPNPMTYFKIDEKNKTVKKMPGILLHEPPKPKQSFDLPMPGTVVKSTSSKTAVPVVQQPAPSTTIPVPPQKPLTFNASQDFLRQARDNENHPQVQAQISTPARPQKPHIQHPQKSLITRHNAEPLSKPDQKSTPLRPVKGDVSEDNLVKPTLQDIWESIDPAGARQQSQAAKNNGLSLTYKPGIIELPENIKTILAGGLLSQLNKKRGTRLEIIGYASAPLNDKTEARRISLARAAAVQDFMVQKNIDAERIDIRPMGLQTGASGRADRVDLQILEP